MGYAQPFLPSRNNPTGTSSSHLRPALQAMMERLLQRRSALLTSAETGWPRVSQGAYEGVFIAYLIAIVIAILVRVVVKYRYRRRFELDDTFLFLAFFASISSWGCIWQVRGLVYWQMELVLGMRAIVLEDIDRMLVYFKWYNVSLITTWISVYSVKLSFMFFFRRLISRVKPLEIYWRVVMCIIISTATFSAFFSFWICPDLTVTYVANCPISSMVYREATYLYVISALDIFTDLLIISIPISLLSKVSIAFKRKVILGFALSLNIFMIVICTVRAATCKLSNGVIDSTWLGLWQCFETNTAIVIMSLTAYRSLYRHGVSPNYIAPDGPRKRPLWPSMRPFKRPSRKQSRKQEAQENVVAAVLPEKPPKAATVVPRTATEEEINTQLLSSLNFTLTTSESTVISEDGL